jgi:hypothetical protein
VAAHPEPAFWKSLIRNTMSAGSTSDSRKLNILNQRTLSRMTNHTMFRMLCSWSLSSSIR